MSSQVQPQLTLLSWCSIRTFWNQAGISTTQYVKNPELTAGTTDQ